jgi:hypothetical protein
MRLLMTGFVLVLVVLVAGGESAARRRPVRCCVMVPDDAGGERPWCFLLNVRPARYGKRVCRLVGGRPAGAWDR